MSISQSTAAVQSLLMQALDTLKGNVTNANDLIDSTSDVHKPSIPGIMFTRLQRLTMTAADAIRAASTEICAATDAWPTINANASKLRRATYIVSEYSEMIQREAEVSDNENWPVIKQVIKIAHEISRNTEELSKAFSTALIEEHKTCRAHEQVTDLRNIASGSRQVRKTQLRVAEAAEMVAYCASSLGTEARIAVQLLNIATEAEKVARASGEGLTGIVTGSLQCLDTASNAASMAADGVQIASNKVLEYADEYILRGYMNSGAATGLATFIDIVFKSAVINRPITNASTLGGVDYITKAVQEQSTRVSMLREGISKDCIDVFTEYESSLLSDVNVPQATSPSVEHGVGDARPSNVEQTTDAGPSNVEQTADTGTSNAEPTADAGTSNVEQTTDAGPSNVEQTADTGPSNVEQTADAGPSNVECVKVVVYARPSNVEQTADAGPSNVECVKVVVYARPSRDSEQLLNLTKESAKRLSVVTEFAKRLSERSTFGECNTSWEFKDAFCVLVEEHLEIARDEAIEMMAPEAERQEVEHHFLNSKSFKALMEKAKTIDNLPTDTVLMNFARQTLRSPSDVLSSVKLAAKVAKKAAKRAQKALTSINRARVAIISPLDRKCLSQRQDAGEDEYLEVVLESTKDARQRVQEAFAISAAYEASNVAEKLKVIIESSRRTNKLIQYLVEVFKYNKGARQWIQSVFAPKVTHEESNVARNLKIKVAGKLKNILPPRLHY
ncbi:hypothetical protein BG005_001329 [Podila minutissima]|nr:hypothetical protein BG005_001329 [Podila minutissima]